MVLDQILAVNKNLFTMNLWNITLMSKVANKRSGLIENRKV
ncbi:MAG: hypothetical protein ACI97X_001948 [Oceanospirillaceae bacterium]|jgi:hypothetical protein